LTARTHGPGDDARVFERRGAARRVRPDGLTRDAFSRLLGMRTIGCVPPQSRIDAYGDALPHVPSQEPTEQVIAHHVNEPFRRREPSA